MLKIDKAAFDKMESQHPGLGETIMQFEGASLPACSFCRSGDTANVQCGVIGRTIYLATATTKFKLIANGPKPGHYFCNTCSEFFD